MNKLKILFLSVSLLSGLCTKAQVVIDINKGGYFVNSQKIEYPAAVQMLTKTLGSDYRTFDGINTIYTYDQLGIRLYEPPGSHIISSLCVDFTIGSYKFSPQKVFNGIIEINGHIIDKSFTKDSLGNISELFFEPGSSIKTSCAAVTYNDVKVYFTFNADGSIYYISVDFAAKGAYQASYERSDAHSTFVNIDFKFERGITNSHGKKIGVWEYRDNSAKLDLKYDHDKDSIMYLAKTDSDFVIKDGKNWIHSKLDIYPRVIASYSTFKLALGKLINYPESARYQRIMGRVYISFIIDKTGKIKDVKIEKDIGGDCGMAVVNALTLLKVSWTHAIKNNIAYDSKFIIPVSFVLGLENNIPTLPPDGKLSLPDAYILPEFRMVALGTPHPIKY